MDVDDENKLARIDYNIKIEMNTVSEHLKKINKNKKLGLEMKHSLNNNIMLSQLNIKSTSLVLINKWKISQKASLMIFQLIVNDKDVLINKTEWNFKSTINNEQPFTNEEVIIVNNLNLITQRAKNDHDIDINAI